MVKTKTKTKKAGYERDNHVGTYLILLVVAVGSWLAVFQNFHSFLNKLNARHRELHSEHVPWNWSTVPSSVDNKKQEPHNNHQHQHNNNTLTTSLFRPPKCTPEQLDKIQLQLPSNRCIQFANQPWTSDCSFSAATSCPESGRLEDHF